MKFNRRQLLADLQPFLAMSKEGQLSEHYTGVQIDTVNWTAVNQFGHLCMPSGVGQDLEVRIEVAPLCRLLASSSADAIELKESKGKLVFTAPGHSAKLPIYPHADWKPSVCEYNVCTTSPVPAILGAIGASMEDAKRASCNGVQLRDGWAMTTDSVRLMAHRTTFEGHMRIPLPAAKMLKFVSILSKFEYSATHFRSVDSSYVYTAQLDPQPCINWLPVLKPREHTVCLTRADLLGALKRSQVLGQGFVDIEASGGELIMTVPDESRVVIECQGDIKTPIRLNPSFLSDALSTLKESKVVLEFTDDLKPVVIQEGDLLHMLMPIARLGR